MKFLITNRDKITCLKLEISHIVISICEPEKDFPELLENNKRLGLLQLIFTDEDKVGSAKQIGQEHLLMTKEQAQEVISFIDKHSDLAEAIVCQCDGGISRSSGMAAALSKILNGDDSWIFNSKEYVPNMYVYKMIMNEYYSNI